MLRNYKLYLLGLAFMASATTAFPQTIKVEKQVAKAMKKVEPKTIKAHIDYLADDKLAGRKPGTEGFTMAADYVIAQYKKYGVEPGAENNSYLQPVKIRQSKTRPGATMAIVGENAKQLNYGSDFVIYPNPGKAEVTIEAPLVFAGFGITAPELNYDDYAGIDAKGKIVVLFRGAPANFPSTISAYSMDPQNALKNAVAHGAKGVIIVNANPKGQLPSLSNGTNSILSENGPVSTAYTNFHSNIDLTAMISYATFEQLSAGTNFDMVKTIENLRSGKPASMALPATIKANYSSTYSDIESYNVVGKITGSDPVLKNEYIVHSAHLDHVGIGRPVKGDSIYNGAHDNASGVASLLEIANIYNRLKEKPKRSILLVMVTAEEMGLLGSGYFAQHPTVPAGSIVANVNTDMPTLIAPLLSVVPLGAQHSSLATQVAQASKYMGLTVEEDPEPEQNRFIRSDQYSFVVAGIPALHIKYGNKTRDGKNNLDVTVKEWRELYYHEPLDNPDGIFDYNAGKTYVQLNFLIGYLVAQQPERPTWNPNDFFGNRAKPQL